MMYCRSGSRSPTSGTHAWRTLAIKEVSTVTTLEMVAWETVWMSASISWVRMCLSINKVTWIQRNNLKVRDPAAGRFPEQAVWISSHKFVGSGHSQGVWQYSR